MKSAYELAMEKLDAGEPKRKELTAEQKEQLADISQKFSAKIAEREVFLGKQIEKARAEGDYAEEQNLLKQLASDRATLTEDMEAQKEKIRNQ